MRKVLNILILVFLTMMIFNCRVQNKSDISFDQYFDENCDNYKFMIKNPNYYQPKYFIPKLNGLKSRYILEIKEDYQMDKEGNKYYGDGDIINTYYTYYKFDDEGKIEVEYYIIMNSLEKVEIAMQYMYRYTNSRYVLTTYDVLKKSEEVDEYIIKTENGRTILIKEDETGETYQRIYENGKIITTKLFEDGFGVKNEYIYINDNVYWKSYNIINDEEKLVWTWTYKKGAIQEKIRVNEFYEDIYVYVINEDGKGEVINTYTRDGETTISSNYLERRYHDLGFLEYEIECPQKDGGAGSYKITTRKLLDEPDELLLKYFGDVINKK